MGCCFNSVTLKSTVTDLSSVVDEGRPVEQVDGLFEAEHGLLCQLSPLRPVPVSALNLGLSLKLSPGKLLEPHLFKSCTLFLSFAHINSAVPKQALASTCLAPDLMISHHGIAALFSPLVAPLYLWFF